MSNENALFDRSRLLTAQTCPRMRWLSYEYRGRGISPRTYPIPLITGIAVHEGLSWLLKANLDKTFIGWCNNCKSALEWEVTMMDWVAAEGQNFLCGECRLPVQVTSRYLQPAVVEIAVFAALTSFDRGVSKRQLALDSDEDPGYAYLEQRALVEALVRVYALVQLPRLVEEYEILEVERDEVWRDFAPGVDFMFKADGLLKHRDTGDLHILSFKTASQYGKLNDDSARYDVQGLSELAGIENRLREEWESNPLNRCTNHPDLLATGTNGFYNLCVECVELWKKRGNRPNESLPSQPPRIEAIRMEYLIKGPRLKDNYDGGTKKQNSFLVRPWMKVTNLGENLYSWRWEYEDDLGQKKRLSARDWKRVNIWEHMPIAEWVRMLHNQEVFPNPDFYFESPLEEVVKTPVPYMRQQREILDFLEQAREQESNISKHVKLVEMVDDEAERRSRLNRFFPQFRANCQMQFGLPCGYIDVCHNGLSPDPEDSEFIFRQPHHEEERLRQEQLYQISR
jgi:hypothetical protein